MMTAPTFPGSNINLVKAHNLQAILLSLLHSGKLSRIQLAKNTSLSTTTITNLIFELLEEGVVVEEGTQVNNNQRKVGRPRTALRLVPNARIAIGVHIGIGLYRVALVNLCAEIITNTIEQYSLDSAPDEVLGSIANTIKTLVEKSCVENNSIIGVGVGASGLVNYETGVNISAPNLGWDNVPVQSYLESKLNYQVTVDNNVRAMALGEAFFGSGRGIDTLAFVYGRVGVGAGFVFNGQIYHGSNTGAGEIGHIKMVPDGGEICRCGKRGCLETLVSEPAIIKQARQIAEGNPNGQLAQFLKEAENSSELELIFDAARYGDKETLAMIDEKACYLGLALANLVNILNPELIILGGMFFPIHFLPHWLQQTARYLPFAFSAYWPGIVMVDFSLESFSIGVAGQAVYILVLSGLAMVLFGLGKRRIHVQGG